MIRRYSSRTHRLDTSFLLDRLKEARSYKRIAGYFTSSLFEVAHEELEAIPDVKIVCNVDIHPEDLRVAQLREAKMIGRWNGNAIEAEALEHKKRYQRLDEFLAKRGQAIRVAPDSVCGFLHGKAGVIELNDGRKLGFMGSMNETLSGWRKHYEILWEDDSPEGVAWIEKEFAYLWNAAHPLPEAIIREVRRRGYRREVELDDVEDEEQVAPATHIESPMYREGLELQPWQRGFITECILHYKNHGVVRLLLADEVGLGKTLSLGTALIALLLIQEKSKTRRKPAIILAPATLCEQWQTEMIDKLGIPCARWDTLNKEWLNEEGRGISPRGREHIARCPSRIGIVSTGLMIRNSDERQYLLGLRYSVVILDEAHKARSRQALGSEKGQPNELLRFMFNITAQADHVLLGTATPIQTKPEDLWDLMRILHQGNGRFVLGNDFSPWHDPEEVLPILSGEERVAEIEYGWNLLRSPLPLVNSTREPRARKLISEIRSDLGLRDSQWDANRLDRLSHDTREDFEEELHRDMDGSSFFRRENPFVRHVVLRKRSTLEDKGLLKKIAVDLHPSEDLSRDTVSFNALFEGKAIRVSEDFRQAYNEARNFGKILGRRGRGGGFMKNLMEQRICSSVTAGINTAQKLLAGDTIQAEDDDLELDIAVEDDEERKSLRYLIALLQQVDDDPKLRAITHFLDTEKWLDFGVIIFSQYYDTSKWIADKLAGHYPSEIVGLYAGAGKSRLYKDGESVGIQRETIKTMVAEHQIRLMIATDAACEGLNLQTLGTLINVDLPWNPTKLEQRIGRIKRFGQVRDKVDMLNLVNQDTVDEKVYERLSERMRDRYDLFGSLPDTIKDEWIADIETLGEKMDEYIEAQKQATGFDLRYNTTISPDDNDWRDTASVLSRRDLTELMGKGWQ